MDKKQIKILFLAAEAAPLAKVGGLGDVAGALPKALFNLGADIRLCLPFYGSIDKNKTAIGQIAVDVVARYGRTKEKFSVWETKLPGSNVLVYLIKHKYFDSQNVYQDTREFLEKKQSRRDGDLKRFSFYAAASLTLAKKLNFRPDIIHLNDWHAALTASYLADLKKSDKFFQKIKTIYTIHNLANQGVVLASEIKEAGVNAAQPSVKADLENGDLNFMVQGILQSDIVTTVSPAYAKEILDNKNGAGLDKILKKRQGKIRGIINGIDDDFFNPAKDGLIKQKYDVRSLAKKADNKILLQKELGLKSGRKIALIGMVSRFVWQKGIDLLLDENFWQSFNVRSGEYQFVFLGAGQKEYEEKLKKLAVRRPDTLSVNIRFDEQLAHRIYAGTDIFLVPSRFEPCGLTQMIAMRYGAVPVVRRTGGLADTVNSRCGFVFENADSEELAKTIRRALDTYYNRPDIWRRLQIRGMKKDFSWTNSAKKYLKLYRNLIQKS